MSQMKDAKKQYDEIPIPEELSARVQEAIDSSERRRQEEKKVIPMAAKRRTWKKAVTAAAAAMVVFTTGLNTSTAFAETMAQLPVVGVVAQVLTFRSYEKTEDGMKIQVDVPSLELISEQETGLDESINQEIHKFCQQYADEAVDRAMEYKEAFLATGGTKEEWEAHHIQIQVGYEILTQTEDYLSFTVSGTENWNSANTEVRYYNLDLKTGKQVTLKEMLGEDYIQIASDSVKAQMAEMKESKGVEFFAAEEGGFTEISPDISFYISEGGNPILVFEQYEIAPGAYGRLEFEVAGRS